MRELSLAQARRVALAAQGFGRPRPSRPDGARAVTMRDVQGLVDRLAQFQIDTISVVARAHQFPLFSRLGPYDTALLERAVGQSPRRLVEYWAHAASMVDVRLHPQLRFRMARAADEAWGGMRSIATEESELVAAVLQEVRGHGPIGARQVEAALLARGEGREREHWGWNWSQTKRALEWLFWSGQVTSARRTASFERLYDLPERVIPASIHQASTPTDAEAHVELVRRSARALGVGSEACLADYFRLSRVETRAAIAELAARGELEEVRVNGWAARTWLWIGDGPVRIPRRIRARALVSPFDSLVFERSRALALFGLDYRIEIYVPEAQRRHGYYVYPFLLDEQFVARVDLKADRPAGVLRVKASWLEPDTGLGADEVCAELLAELHEVARWQQLGEVVVEPRGDLAAALAASQGGQPGHPLVWKGSDIDHGAAAPTDRQKEPNS